MPTRTPRTFAVLAIVAMLLAHSPLPYAIPTAEASTFSFFQNLSSLFGVEKVASAWRSVFGSVPVSSQLGQVVGGDGNNYFSWGVESLYVSWGVGGTSPYPVQFKPNSSRDCAVAHSGSCSMKMDIIGNDAGNQSAGADTIVWPPAYPWDFVSDTSIYYRWWMKIDPGFSWGSGTAKTKSSRVIGTTYPRGYTGYLQDYGFSIGECEDVGISNPGGGCLLPDGSENIDGNLYIPYDFTSRDDGLWHEYIVRIKPNTSATCTAGVNCDAEFEAWVDGVFVGKVVDFKLHNKDGNGMIEAWGGWMVSPYFQLNGTVTDGGIMYIDDVSTDNAWNSMTYPEPVNSDVTSPITSLTAPASGATVSGNTTVSATASDNTAVAGVQFKLDGAKLGAEDTTSPYSITWDTTAVANGSYTLTAVARDSAGNTTTSASRSVMVSNILSVPATTLTASPSSITSGQSSTLTWSSTNSTSCTGTGFNTGGSTSGTTSVSPSNTTTYALACTGAGGTAQSTATVSVTPAPTTTGGSSSSSGGGSSGGSTLSDSTTNNDSPAHVSATTSSSVVWRHTRTLRSPQATIVPAPVAARYGVPYFTYHGIEAPLLKVYDAGTMLILVAGSGSKLQTVSPTAQIYKDGQWHTVPLMRVFPPNPDGTYVGKGYYLLRPEDPLYTTRGAFTASIQMTLPGCDNATCRVNGKVLQEWK